MGHRVRGRYRAGGQIGAAVAGLEPGGFLVLECGSGGHCYAQTCRTADGAFDVEFRDGAPDDHFRAHTPSADAVAAALTAWAEAGPGWSESLEWACIGARFAAAETPVRPLPFDIPVPAAHVVEGARTHGRVPIYHVASAERWRAACADGEYRASAADGLIEACFADQVELMAFATCDPESEPPVVLVLDEEALTAPVRMQRSSGFNGFVPVLAGPLPLAAVCNVLDMSLDSRSGVWWDWGRTGSWRHPVPERIPIAREQGYRTDLAGTYAEGMFLGGFCRTTYLHLFDAEGEHQWSWIAPAERVLGEAAEAGRHLAFLRGLIATLPGCVFTDIAVRPFAVLDEDGGRWGLIDETLEFGFPHAELHPDGLGFHPPWDGLYDT